MDKEFFKNHFFIITNENFEAMTHRFFGNAFDGKQFFINARPDLGLMPTGAAGPYINIVVNDTDIIIQQDFYGLWGIYLYNVDGDFAISNSFLYLLSYLRFRGKKLSYNPTYAKALPWTGTSLAFGQTAINEIESLPHYCMLKISKKTGMLEKIPTLRSVRRVKLDSAEALAILDTWHDTWSSLIAAILAHGSPIRVNISGGMDSRAALAILFRPSGFMQTLDPGDIDFYTSPAPAAWEDHAIACEVGKRLGFDPDLRTPEPASIPVSLFTSLAISFLAKLPFHNEISFRKVFYTRPWFVSGGAGGELLREHWTEPPLEFIQQIIRGVPIDSAISVSESITASMAAIRAEYKNANLTRGLYECMQLRNHFGKYSHENILSNFISLMPLLDPALFSLDLEHVEHRDILFAIIYDRYLAKLDDLPFEGGRMISPEMLEVAKTINTSYPYSPATASNGIKIRIGNLAAPSAGQDEPEPEQWVKSLFHEQGFQSIMEKITGKDTYIIARSALRRPAQRIPHQAMALISLYLCYAATSPALIKNLSDETLLRLLDIYSYVNDLQA